MPRESEAFLLKRHQMHWVEWMVWTTWDVSLTFVRHIAPTFSVTALLATPLLKNDLSPFAPLTPRTVLAKTVYAYLMVELLFYIYFTFKIRAAWRKKPLRAELALANPDDRLRLMGKVLASVKGREEEFLKEWIHDDHDYARNESVHESDVRHFVAFVLFHEEDPSKVKERDELDRLVGMALDTLESSRVVRGKEDLGNRSLKFSYATPNAVSMHRPLAMLFVVDTLFQDVIVPYRMMSHGYRRESHTVNGYRLNYWVRRGSRSTSPPRSEEAKPTPRPLVFFHGIGVGVTPYFHFFDQLEASLDEATSAAHAERRTIVIFEIEAIAQRFNPPPLEIDHFVATVMGAMRGEGVGVTPQDKMTVVAHSYGTFVASWFVKRHPEAIHALALLDPASLLLHKPDVLYNMIYRRPTESSLDRVLHYVMRADYFFQRHLRDDFHWWENILFIDDVQERVAEPNGTSVLVVLSDTDQVIPARSIERYLRAHSDRVSAGGGVPLKLITLAGAEHAEFLVRQGYSKQVRTAMDEWFKAGA